MPQAAITLGPSVTDGSCSTSRWTTPRRWSAFFPSRTPPPHSTRAIFRIDRYTCSDRASRRQERRVCPVVGRPWTYLPAEPAAIAVDRQFYERIADETDGRMLVHRHIVPIRSGYAWPVRAGQVCRVV